MKRAGLTLAGLVAALVSSTALVRADVMRDVISNGTPRMPGFKYHFTSDQIDAIVVYVKTLPANR